MGRAETFTSIRFSWNSQQFISADQILKMVHGRASDQIGKRPVDENQMQKMRSSCVRVFVHKWLTSNVHRDSDSSDAGSQIADAFAELKASVKQK